MNNGGTTTPVTDAGAGMPCLLGRRSRPFVASGLWYSPLLFGTLYMTVRGADRYVTYRSRR